MKNPFPQIFAVALLFFFLSDIKINAQNYTPFPDTAGIWINTYGEYIWQPGNPIPTLVINGTKQYSTDGSDTTIQNKVYSRIWEDNLLYKGGIREQSDRIYFIPADSVQEFLLYDFSVQGGDTLDSIYTENFFDGSVYLSTWVIPQNGVDSVQINGEWRRRIGGEWISGIGNRQGLFMEYWTNVSNYQLSLSCMSVSDTTYFPNYTIGFCGNLNQTLEQPTYSAFEIYPNPCLDWLWIDIAKNDKTCSSPLLRDVSGKLIKVHFETTSNGFRMNAEGLKPGIYFLEYQSLVKRISVTN